MTLTILPANVYEVKDFAPEASGDAAVTWADQFRTQLSPTTVRLIRAYKGLIYACANINAQAVAAVPIRLYVKTLKGQSRAKCPTRKLSADEWRWVTKSSLSFDTKVVDVEEVMDHQILDLFREVNEYHDAFTLLELTQLYQEVEGSSYWHIELGPLGIPEKLWILPPQQVTTLAGRGGDELIAGYEYGQGKSKQTFGVEDVIAFRMPSLNDPYLKGTSPARACWEAWNLLEKSLSHAAALMDNRARPDMVISPKDPVGGDEAERLEKRVQKRFRQAGAGSILVLDESYDVKPITVSPKDLEMLALYGVTKTELANCFGVPMSLLETKDVNRANAEAGHYQHAKLAIYPRLRRRDERLNQKLCPLYDPRLFVVSDNPVPEDTERKISMRTANINAGVTVINEERQTDGLPPVPWGDEPWLSTTLMQPSMPRPVAPGPVQQMACPDCGGTHKHAHPERKDTNKHDLPRGRKLEGILVDIFRDQRKEIIKDRTKAVGKQADLITPIDLSNWTNPMADLTQGVMGEAFDAGAKRTAGRIATDVPAARVWTLEAPEVQASIRTASLSFCEATNKTTSLELNKALSLLRNEMATGLLTEGETLTELTRRVNTIFDQAETYRARRIAVTETSRGYHEGQRIAAENTGVVKGFKWLLSSDPCPICIEIAAKNPEGIPLDGKFGFEGTHPEYSNIRHPPVHPNCLCALIEILA